MKKGLKLAVIGGGAAGFFAAISAAEHHAESHAESHVVLFEKSDKLLAKVKVSGGGRCNVTNECRTPSALSKNYPRGGASLKKAFQQFDGNHTVDWFARRGVELKAEPDGRMFPVSDSSQTIVDCLTRAAQSARVEIRLRTPVIQLTASTKGAPFHINGEAFDRVIIATGGSPKSSGFDWLRALGHTAVDPVPSLFTFNMPTEPVKQWMGVTIPNALVRIQGSKLQQTGPVLITHWGMSGPAVLKLSAWGARELAARGYAFTAQVNWIGNPNESDALATLEAALPELRKKKMANACPFHIPKKFWAYLLERAGLNPESSWAELSSKSRNKLINVLLNDGYAVQGKTTFKEEFVTCGGVSLDEVDFKTMQSRFIPGLCFAGEVLDVDGVTGGFNFQAAWTTGFIAGRSAATSSATSADTSSAPATS